MSLNTSTTTINASPQKVFDVLTKPELVKLWQFGKLLITDWQMGSSIEFRAEWEGRTLKQWGTVLEIRTNELIKYNLFTPKPGLEDKKENYCVTSYLLTQEAEQTNLTLVQEDNTPNVFPAGNLDPILAVLKKTAESI